MFRSCSPIIPVSDLAAAAAFWHNALGFETGVLQQDYASLRKDGAILRLVRKGEDMVMDDPRRQQSCYIEVDDVDAVYAAHRGALDALPEGRFRAPFDQPYGMRELHVIYESLLIFVGQPIRE